MCIIFLNCGKIKGKKALIYFAPATKSKKFSKKYWAEKRDCCLSEKSLKQQPLQFVEPASLLTVLYSFYDPTL